MDKRHEIIYYQDRRGNRPVRDFIDQLSAGKGKDDRINAQKIRGYIYALHLGRIREMTKLERVKYLEEGIFELRPLNHRITFFIDLQKHYVLLHHFYKQTQKTQVANKRNNHHRNGIS